jgi:CRP-like cAMP-binding protein
MISPELLRRSPFFGFLDDNQLRALAMIAEEREYTKDEVLVESGAPANELFLLLDGAVSYYYVVTTEHDPYYKQEYYISDINPGEIFGISALIDPYLYTATLRTEKPCRTIRIDAPSLRALCEVDPKLSCGMQRAVAKAAMERLQHTRVQLVAAKS